MNEQILVETTVPSTAASLDRKVSPWKIISQHVMLELPFRVFFFAAAVTAVLSMLMWLLQLNSWLALTQTLSGTVWHAHEMIFGFAATAAIAFLLTASQTWTGRRSIHGTALLILLLLWLAIRVLLISDYIGSLWLAILFQFLWWLGAIIVFANQVIRAGSHRNYLFIPLLSVLALLNTATLLADLLGRSDLALHFIRTTILQFALLMTAVGGRVIPLFTQLGLSRPRPIHSAWLDKALLLTSLLCSILFFGSFWINLTFIPAQLMMASGLLHLFRLSKWDSLSTSKVPLLWSLHVSYLALAMGLIAMSLSYWLDFITFSNALHLTTIGAIGFMILAIMSRVSLGHTGRQLKSYPTITIAYILLIIAALIRLIFPMNGLFILGWNISGSLWIVSFSLFLYIYTPILLKAKKLAI